MCTETQISVCNVYLYVQTQPYTHTYITYIHTQKHTHTHTYIDIHMCTHIHAHTHTHTKREILKVCWIGKVVEYGKREEKGVNLIEIYNMNFSKN